MNNAIPVPRPRTDASFVLNLCQPISSCPLLNYAAQHCVQNGETFHGKALVLNFFASWCDPCRDEMPLINELAAQGNKDGFNVLGIAVEDTRAAVSEFAKEAKLVFPIALDLNNTVKRAYRIFGPPATFFIDSQGIIRDVVLGPVTRERTLEAIKKSAVIGKN